MPCAIALLRLKAIAVFCSKNRIVVEKLKKGVLAMKVRNKSPSCSTWFA